MEDNAEPKLDELLEPTDTIVIETDEDDDRGGELDADQDGDLPNPVLT